MDYEDEIKRLMYEMYVSDHTQYINSLYSITADLYPYDVFFTTSSINLDYYRKRVNVIMRKFKIQKIKSKMI